MTSPPELHAGKSSQMVGHEVNGSCLNRAHMTFIYPFVPCPIGFAGISGEVDFGVVFIFVNHRKEQGSGRDDRRIVIIGDTKML